MSLLGEHLDVRRRNNVQLTGNPSGRTLMFAHGFGCSQEMWHAVAAQFEDDFQVLLFDHVGAGGSDLQAYDRAKYDSLRGYAQDVVDIVEQLDLRDVVFVAHSVSSMIGALATTMAPDRFGALVMVGPSPKYVNSGDYVGGFEQADIDALLDALDMDYLGWATTMAPVIAGNPDRPQIGEQLANSFCMVDPAIARHFARVTFLSDNRRDLPGVPVPTLIMQCSADPIAPEVVGRYVHARIPGSVFVHLAATGHCPNLSHPDEVAVQLRRFLT